LPAGDDEPRCLGDFRKDDPVTLIDFEGADEKTFQPVCQNVPLVLQLMGQAIRYGLKVSANYGLKLSEAGAEHAPRRVDQREEIIRRRLSRDSLC